MATKRDPDDVEYQPPGSTEWRRVEDLLPREAQEKTKTRNDRALARRLLAEGEAAARSILKRSQEAQRRRNAEARTEGEVAELERDMAAALGNFERFVAAGARKMKYDVEDVINELRSKKK